MDDLPDSSKTRRRHLTKQRVVEAALDIIDRDGLAALNMRRLGAELDVKAMAVYRHFATKDAILDEIVESVLSGLAESASGADWRATYRMAFISLRALLRAHPNALPLVASRPLASPQLRKRLEATRDALLEARLAEADVLHLLHAGISLTIGYLWLEAGGFVGELPDAAPFLRTSAYLRPQDPGDSPLAASSTWDRDEDFEAGLDLLVTEPQSGRTGQTTT